MSFGCIAKRTGDRDPLLLAAGELVGVGVDLGRQPDAFEQGLGPSQDLRLRLLFHEHRCGGDVLERGHVGEQVETLEDHADLGAAAADLALVQLVQASAALFVADELPVDIRAGPS